MPLGAIKYGVMQVAKIHTLLTPYTFLFSPFQTINFKYVYMRYRSISMLLLFFLSVSLTAQTRWDAARIQLEMQKLQVVGNVLYLAAHPDDENTRLIAWLANEKKVRTAYLSLTRGDGGQNLIGDEKGPLMGLIRTQELREARKIDGGEQFFTRALDFGYSKTDTETLAKWERDSILKDVVMTIRKFKPDVIVTRFPPTKYAGHGHHSASAILAEEAFDLASDPAQFPESAQRYGTWQPTRLFFNNSPWWDKDIDERRDEFVTVDVGTYNPLLGVSYTELAGMSRSQHRSQGFGAALSKGEQWEYLELRKGEAATNDLFDGIDLSWNRLNGTNTIDKQVQTLLSNYNSNAPEESVEALIDLYFALDELESEHWIAHQKEKVKELIAACGGLWMEFLADEPTVVKGETFSARTEVIAQTTYPFQLQSVAVKSQVKQVDKTLNNEVLSTEFELTAPGAITQPYWLKQPAKHDMFQIERKELLGLPQNLAFTFAAFTFSTPQGEITFQRPIRYKWVDRADGELYRDVNVIPELSVTPDKKTLVFTDGKPKTITIKIQNRSVKLEDLEIEPQLPKGWKVSPDEWEMSELEPNALHFVTFTIEPPKKQQRAGLNFEFDLGEEEMLAKDYLEISYPHIEKQVVMPNAEVLLVNAPSENKTLKVGYIMGAGDEVTTAIEQLGHTVVPIDLQVVNREQLDQFDVVVLGIRAFNTEEALSTLNQVLFDYAHEGGHLVVQYNTNRGLTADQIAPIPLQLSRDRVTVEEAEATWLQKDHPIFNIPNKLTTQDFDGWNQERGLYFADEWDEQFTPLISWQDPEETPKKGGLLVADVGKGTYIYTGISFFRHLPAGVPGSYRLLANILNYGQE